LALGLLTEAVHRDAFAEVARFSGTVDSGQWTVGSGQWTVDSLQVETTQVAHLKTETTYSLRNVTV
jgi:hypothetical protein